MKKQKIEVESVSMLNEDDPMAPAIDGLEIRGLVKGLIRLTEEQGRDLLRQLRRELR